MVARERVLFVGIFTALFGIAMLVAVVVIYKASTPWRFLVVLLPLVLAGGVGREFRRTVRRPDE